MSIIVWLAAVILGLAAALVVDVLAYYLVSLACRLCGIVSAAVQEKRRRELEKRRQEELRSRQAGKEKEKGE
jgi:hypothetical protein